MEFSALKSRFPYFGYTRNGATEPKKRRGEGSKNGQKETLAVQVKTKYGSSTIIGKITVFIQTQ